MKNIILAHYYCTPDVQNIADFVGDSLDLAVQAINTNADRIIFAGVRFMAETTKILNPNAVVILPSSKSTCSLVTQTDIVALRLWVEYHQEKARLVGKDLVHVTYINSSAEHKALSDIVVTSRIVDDVIAELYNQNKYVIFSPDYNMGQYLNYQYGYNMPVWTAVCVVHDNFKKHELELAMAGWVDGGKYVIAHPESPLPILQKANFVGSTHSMLEWITKFPYKVGTIWVATEVGLLHNMKMLRPELDIRQAPGYSGCQCNSCEYMKLNTVDNIKSADTQGEQITISDQHIVQSRVAINRMITFQQTGIIDL